MLQWDAQTAQHNFFAQWIGIITPQQQMQINKVQEEHDKEKMTNIS